MSLVHIKPSNTLTSLALCRAAALICRWLAPTHLSQFHFPAWCCHASSSLLLTSPDVDFLTVPANVPLYTRRDRAAAWLVSCRGAGELRGWVNEAGRLQVSCMRFSPLAAGTVKGLRCMQSTFVKAERAGSPRRILKKRTLFCRGQGGRLGHGIGVIRGYFSDLMFQGFLDCGDETGEQKGCWIHACIVD